MTLPLAFRPKSTGDDFDEKYRTFTGMTERHHAFGYVSNNEPQPVMSISVVLL